MVLSVLDGEVCAVLPGALMALVRGYPGLEALPLREPEVRTPIGFMIAPGGAALARARSGAGAGERPGWLEEAAAQGRAAGEPGRRAPGRGDSPANRPVSRFNWTAAGALLG